MESGEEQKGGTYVPPIAERRLPSILVLIMVMVTECTLLLSEFTRFVLNLRLIAAHGVGGLLRLSLLMLVLVPIPRPESLVHFALPMLEVIPVMSLGSARLVYLFALVLDPLPSTRVSVVVVVVVTMGVAARREGQHQCAEGAGH